MTSEAFPTIIIDKVAVCQEEIPQASRRNPSRDNHAIDSFR